MEIKLPDTHQAVMPYLIIQDAGKFIEFLKTVFEAKETSMHRRDESTIQHAEVMIGNSTLMIADRLPEWAPSPAGLFVYVDNADERYKKAIENGAVSLMGLSDQPYGRTCGVTDPFGNVWWITSLP